MVDYKYSPAAAWSLELAQRLASTSGRERYTNADLLAGLISVLLGTDARTPAEEFNESNWTLVCRERSAFKQAWVSIPNIIFSRAASVSPGKEAGESTLGHTGRKEHRLDHLAGFMGIDPQKIRRLLPAMELEPHEELKALLDAAYLRAQDRPYITMFDLFMALIEQEESSLKSWLDEQEIAVDVLMEILDQAREGLLIVRNSTFLVLPFAYHKNYHNALEQLLTESATTNKGKSIKVWNPLEFKTARFFYYIQMLIRTEQKHPATIGCRFQLTGEQQVRAKYKLPSRPNQLIYLHRKEGTVQFYLDDVEIFLFETQVGFLVYQIHYESTQGIDNIILGNYGLKTFCLDDQSLGFLSKAVGSPGENVTFLKEISWRRLDFIESSLDILHQLEVITFFEQEVKKGKGKTGRTEADSREISPPPEPAHALVYSAVVMDKSLADYNGWKQMLMEILFRLRRSFKESYKPSPSEYDVDGNPEVLQFFANSYWGISSEALANLVYLIDDETTNAFFSGNYFGNLKQSYYYLYILALHQRYALLHLAIEAAELPLALQDLTHRDDGNEWQQEESLLESRKKMALFVLRSMFRQVSNISHQNRLYESIRTEFGIEGLIEEINWELKAINSLEQEIVSLERQKTAAYREEERQQWELERLEREKTRDEERSRWEQDKQERERMQREEHSRIEQERKEQEEQRNREQEAEQKMQRFILLVSTGFLIITTIEASWQIYSFITNGNYPEPGSLCFILMLILITSIIGLVIIGGIYYFSQWRKVKNQPEPLADQHQQNTAARVDACL